MSEENHRVWAWGPAAQVVVVMIVLLLAVSNVEKVVTLNNAWD